MCVCVCVCVCVYLLERIEYEVPRGAEQPAHAVRDVEECLERLDVFGRQPCVRQRLVRRVDGRKGNRTRVVANLAASTRRQRVLAQRGEEGISRLVEL